MAPGPKHASPSKARPPRTPRRFTLEQANATLPYVRRVVADIVQMHERMAAIKGASGKEQFPPELDALEHRLQDLLDELADVGCDLKDPRQGLVDFTGQHEGRDVYLCWKFGEERIAYWHEISTGFTGRQPVSRLLEN